MDTLEAFEYSQTLPKNQLFFIRHPHVPVFPIKVKEDLRQHQQDFSRSTVFFLNDDIVLKMQNQNRVTDVKLPSERVLLDLSLGSFVSRGPERDIFTKLKSTPHPNLVRELDICEPYVAFFERLSPLSTVLGNSNMPRRRRWVMELVSAFAHLGNMGLAPDSCSGSLY